MFERFTDRARRVIVLAQEETRVLGHSAVDTEHLLLALLAEGEGLAFKAMDRAGITYEAMSAQVVDLIGEGGAIAPVGQHLAFTPRAKKVLAESLKTAVRLGHGYIGTEHLLLGLLDADDPAVVQVLEGLHVSVDGLRGTTMGLLDEYAPSPAPEPPKRGRRARTAHEVLALHQFPEGDSGGCTAQDGWGLAVSEHDDNWQMALHQLEKLAEAGFTVVRK